MEYKNMMDIQNVSTTSGLKPRTVGCRWLRKMARLKNFLVFLVKALSREDETPFESLMDQLTTPLASMTKTEAATNAIPRAWEVLMLPRLFLTEM